MSTGTDLVFFCIALGSLVFCSVGLLNSDAVRATSLSSTIMTDSLSQVFT
eukprot:m.121018 g.121018  ORF g.121018 m.121018 type:complete len:50 (+) comp17258_c0_seq1:136-285(+)